jgi:AraC-like DNA-binding protein
VTGFADTAHFTRTFKQATGSTPSGWRTEHAVSAS